MVRVDVIFDGGSYSGESISETGIYGPDDINTTETFVFHCISPYRNVYGLMGVIMKYDDSVLTADHDTHPRRMCV